MTTDQQVTHPPVSHPDPTPQTVFPAVVGKATEKLSTGRTTRRKAKLPPPKTLAALVLALAAVELLIWQVGGVFWGVLVHAVLAGAVLVTAGVVLWWRRGRERRTARGTGGAGSTRSAGAGASGRRSLLSRLRPGGSGRAAGSAGTGRSGTAAPRGGALGRLLSGRGRKSSGGTSTNGSGRSRNPFAGLFKPSGRSSRSASLGAGRTAAGRAGGRSAGTKSSSGNPLRGLPGGARARRTSSTGSNSSAAAGKKPNRKPMSVWKDFVAGWRGEGAKKKEEVKPTAKEEKHKPSPGPHAETKPPATNPAHKEKPAKLTTEQMVKEAVQQAADATPAPVIPHARGGNDVGDMNKIRAAADEFAAAIREYDPEDMHQMVREMPHLGEALNGISAGLRQMASRAETEWPVATEVAEGVRSIADDIRAAAGTAEETRGTIRKENETDIERGEAPRHGSINVERKWNV